MNAREWIHPLRMQAVQSPIIPIVGEMIRNSPGTISLGQGVVFYPPPPEARAQLELFFENPTLHKYQAVQGVPELLAAIASKLQYENKIRAGTESQVIVTAGGNMAFMNAVLAITDPGDEVIVQAPYYFNHEMAITISGCKPVLVPTDLNYQLQVDAMRAAITPKTRAIVTISPNNPTGAVYPEEALRAVNELCRDRGLYHIHDEAYEYFTYDGAEHFSPGSIDGSASHTISLFSLSKAYGFASWRIGYMTIPAHLFSCIKKIQDTILICPPVISQYAAVGAMGAGRGYCQEKLKSLASVRNLVLESLKSISDFSFVPEAKGAFYFLLRLETDWDPVRLVERLVQEFKVAAIPGSAFGAAPGCYLRIAYGALEKETVAEGIGRLTRGLRVLAREK